MEDSYGRPLNGSNQQSYFTNDNSYEPPANREPRDRAPNNERSPDVSPELIAAISQRVKQELLEELKAQAGRDEQAPLSERCTDSIISLVLDQAGRRDHSTRSGSSTPPHPPDDTRRVYTPPSPIHAQPVPQPPATEPARSPPLSPSEDKPSGVRFSDRRPTAGGRSFSTAILSTIDQYVQISLHKRHFLYGSSGLRELAEEPNMSSFLESSCSQTPNPKILLFTVLITPENGAGCSIPTAIQRQD